MRCLSSPQHATELGWTLSADRRVALALRVVVGYVDASV
jgi:hypothetical protein